jgi:hypothetical protein
VGGVFAAETAILVHFQPIWRVLFVLHGVVVALLAFLAGKGNFDAHSCTSKFFGVFPAGHTSSLKQGGILSTKKEPSAR